MSEPYESGDRVQFIDEGEMTFGTLVSTVPDATLPTWTVELDVADPNVAAARVYVPERLFMRVPPAPEVNARDVGAAMFLADTYKTLCRLRFSLDRVITLENNVVLLWSTADPLSFVAVGPYGSFLENVAGDVILRESLPNAVLAGEQGAMQMAIEGLHAAMLRKNAETGVGPDGGKLE